MRISALRTRSSWPLVWGERMKRRILGDATRRDGTRRDVPGVCSARRQYFPSPSDEYLSVRALPPELERGTFCRTCALHRPGGSVLPSGTHVPCPDRTRLCRARDYPLSVSPFRSRSPDDHTQHPAVPESTPDQSHGFIARAWIAREISLVESTRFRTVDRYSSKRKARFVFATRDKWRRAPIN